METEPVKYNCLVIDDEPIARKIVVNYINEMPLLNLSAECINALGAIEYLRAHKNVDIIFLDINLPNLSGMQMVKIAQPHQPVIFTTAYPEYAVESYELDAVDYLLKPFSFARFARAAYKAIDFITAAAGPAQPVVEDQKTIFLKSDGINYPVKLDEILYCEARKNYTMVKLRNEAELLPLISLSKLETALAQAGENFVQVHRSFIISRKYITAVRPGTVFLGKFEVPIGVQYKEQFLKTIGMSGPA